MNKIQKSFGFALISIVLLTTACFAEEKATASSEAAITPSDTAAVELTLTLEELSAFNGKNGAKAYVAIDGIIYDVTNVKPWKGGKHHGNQAGNDYSAVIKKAPHGKSVLKKLTVIGKLKSSEEK